MRIRSTLVAAGVVGALSSFVGAEQPCTDPGVLCVPDEYTTIQAAINAASDGDVVQVAADTYHEAIDFHGKAIRVYAKDGIDSVPETVIDATNLNTSAVTFKNGEQADSILDGFTIRNGTGTPYAGLTVGGGIYIRSCGPTIRNSIIEDCSAGGGGGIGQINGYATVDNCIIRENSASEGGTYGGGGVYVKFGAMTLSQCTIVDNLNTGWSPGGGISCDFGVVEARNCLIARNNATTWGGGTFNSSGALTMTNCTVVENSAGFSGGGVYTQYAATVTNVVNSVIWSNDAVYEFPEIHDHMGAMTNVLFCNVVRSTPSGEFVYNNPVFDTAPEAGRYRLSAASPCVDAGLNDPWPAGNEHLDLAGLPRLVSSAANPQPVVDLGAYEFQGSTPPDEEPPLPCPDLDGNGEINVFDLLELLATFGDTCSGCPGDADANGVLDVFDLIHLLESWGSCEP